MDWAQVFAILAGNTALIIPLFLWNRAESRSDHRNLETMVNAQIEAIRQDIKDFHGRLCAIEEARKK